MDQGNSNDTPNDKINNEDFECGSSKAMINPFCTEWKERQTNLAKQIIEINKNKPIISFKGERLMVLCNPQTNFRETQKGLDTNTKKYATLHPKDQRPRKISVHGYHAIPKIRLLLIA